MADADLATLVAQAQRMAQQAAGPVLLRNFDLINEEARKLASRTAASGTPSSATGRALHLLAAHGHDAERQTRAIDQMDLTHTFESLEPLQDTDVAGYLRHERELILTTAVEEGRRETLRAYEKTISSTAQADWERTKRRIFEELGHIASASSLPAAAASGAGSGAAGSGDSFLGTRSIDPSAERSMLGVSTMSTSFAQAEPSAAPLLQMHARMMNYATAVERLNQTRLDRADFDFGAACRDVAQRLDRDTTLDADSSWNSFTFCWDLWQHIFAQAGRIETTRAGQRPAAGPSGGAGPLATSPSVATLYNDESPRLTQRLVVASRTFLERQFEQFMDARIAANPRDAQIGGKPGIKERTHAYQKLLMAQLARTSPALVQRLEMHHGVAVWVHLYLVLRSGHARDALELAQTTYSEYFRSRETAFTACLESYVSSDDSSLTPDVRATLQQQLARSDGHDPYRHVVLKVLGRLDLTRKSVPDVIKTSDDYLWLQLHLVRDGTAAPEPRASEADYTLSELQATLNRFGPAHFNASARGVASNPLKFFIVLVLSLQYEQYEGGLRLVTQAVQYLFGVDGAQADAVHMALAATRAGLLHVTLPLADDNAPAALGHAHSVTARRGSRGADRAELDLPQLIQRYIRVFASTDPARAFQYILTITLVRSETAAAAAQALTRRLVLETRQFTALLGALQPDGRLRAGPLQAFAPLLELTNVTAFRDTIIAEAADAADRAGRLDDALLLYNLAQRYNDVLQVLGRRLADRLFHLTEREKNELRSVLGFYQTNGIIAQLDATLVARCQNMLILDDAAAELTAGRLRPAMQLWEASGLLPLGPSPNLDVTLERLSALPARAVPEVLVLAETTIYRLYQTLQGAAPDPSRQQEMARLQQASRNVIALTGRLTQRLPPDAYGKLSQMDVVMS